MNRSTRRLQTGISLSLLALALGLEGLMGFYWLGVLEPQLMSKAEVTARALASSHIHVLADVLDASDAKSLEQTARELKTAMNKILLLRDPHSQEPFILGMELEMDYGAVSAPKGRLNLKAGQLQGFFITELPLYAKQSKELLGIVRLHNSQAFFRHFKADLQFTFFVGAAVTLLLFGLVWAVVAGLFAKIKRAEARLQEKQAQIVHSGRLTAMGEMATGIAHEINQPLAIIRIAAEGLNRFFDKQGIQGMEAKAGATIAEQVKRASAIIDNMRNFARTGTEAAEPTDLSGPISRALSFFQEQFRIHGIVLAKNIEDALPWVRVNPQKFEQIVVNFLSNARHAVEQKAAVYGPDYQKTVKISLIQDDASGDLVFTVADNGMGMDPAVQARCLEPFYTTKGVGEGTGLGLSIVHGIVREFDMRLEVNSQPGEGTAFCLWMKGAKT